MYSGTSGSQAAWRSTGRRRDVFSAQDLRVERRKRDQVEVYDATSYCLMRYLTVPKRISLEFCDMTLCEHNLCLYISDNDKERVHKLGLQGAATRWPVDDELCGLAVNKLHNVMVTCPDVRKIKEFSSDCMLLRELNSLMTSLARGTQYNWPVVSLLCVTVTPMSKMQSTVCAR